ncbi:unnamed protein product, partial [marine sediment metagenome]
AQIVEMESAEGTFGAQVKFTFSIIGGDYAEHTLLGWCSAKFSPRSKLYQWSKAAFNAAIPAEYNFSSADLMDRLVTITVVTQTNDETGAEYNKITDVRPYRGQAANESGGVTQQAPPPPLSPPVNDNDIPF